MEAFKKILKSSALVVGSFFLLRVVAAVEPNTGLFLSGIALLLAAVAFFNPMPQYWIYGRATSVALLVTAMISLAFSGSKLNEERNATLLALRSQNPKAYLERIRPARSNEFFITEARELLRTADPGPPHGRA